jgi:putative FmdB family regulatory protein
MPIYEYRCSKCGDFEVIQKITEKALTKCPTCKAKVNKLMSNTSFQLKGTGWYITDYARSDKGGAAKDAAKASESGASESKSESSSETKSETKSEAKSETKTESKSESKPKSSKNKQAAAA